MISYTYTINQKNRSLYMSSLLSSVSEDADPATIYQDRFELIEYVIRRIKRKEMPDIDVKKDFELSLWMRNAPETKSNHTFNLENEMKEKQTFIWAWAEDGCVHLNTENSLMGIVQDVMECMSHLVEDIEISEMDGHIQISYMNDGESRNYRIENDCNEIEVFVQEFFSEIDRDDAFSIMELVDSNDDSTYDDEPDEAEIASIERHYELYETEGA